MGSSRPRPACKAQHGKAQELPRTPSHRFCSGAGRHARRASLLCVLPYAPARHIRRLFTAGAAGTGCAIKIRALGKQPRKGDRAWIDGIACVHCGGPWALIDPRLVESHPGAVRAALRDDRVASPARSVRSRRKVPTARACASRPSMPRAAGGQQLELVALDVKHKHDAALTAQYGKNPSSPRGVLAFMLLRRPGAVQRWCPSRHPARMRAGRASLRRHELAPPGAGVQARQLPADQRAAPSGDRRQELMTFCTDAGMGANRRLEAAGRVGTRATTAPKPNLAPMMQAVAKAGIEAVVLIGPRWRRGGRWRCGAAGSTAHGPHCPTTTRPPSS